MPGILNLLTTTYNLQTNGRAGRCNRTFHANLRRCVADHPRTWDGFTNARTYVYNTRPHSSIGLASFDFVLARVPPPHIAYQSSPGHYA